MPSWILPAVVCFCILLVANGRLLAADPAGKIDFTRDVRPILSNNCFRCHGPDEAERESDLRLDERDAALALAESGQPAIVPGKPDESPLVTRVLAAKPGLRMPPPKSNKTLTEAEKAILKRWVAEGAEYRQHWAFVPPIRPEIPKTTQADWARGALDRFILARLEAEGLKPSPEADRTTLIRRATIDLTGLPPTPGEVDEFLADTRPDAYGRLIDRLLDSPHFGERMAVDWLDAARYADTHGYHIDSGRDMSRWRAWVIEAYNRNMPFDRFTVEQLAGDLLPTPTLDQKIASGFNRNHMINFEGGAVPEEYHTAYVVDRVNTTTTVWLGLTVACAQCHDHKYDPISQREYYGLYSFFYNVPENGLDGSKGNAAPVIKAPTPEQERVLAELRGAMKAAEDRMTAPDAALDAAQASWEAEAAARVAVWTPVVPAELASSAGTTLKQGPENTITAEGDNPAQETYRLTLPAEVKGTTALRLEALPDDRLPSKGPGRSSSGNIVLTDVRVSVGERRVPVMSASSDFSQTDYGVERAIDDRSDTGWAVYPEVGKAHEAVFALGEAIGGEGPVVVELVFRSQFAQHQLGRFRVSTTTARTPRAGGSGLPGEVTAILATPNEGRSEAQRAALRGYFRTRVATAGRNVGAEIDAIRKRLAAEEAKVPTAMVMEEMSRPRDAFVLVRGQYDKRGEKVAAGVPGVFPPLPKGAPENRLGLARWLVDPSHPLTARVAVNRLWQTIFGTGLVRTSEDFGSQGEPPSHPELLDWLAVEFMRSSEPGAGPWDVKAMVRRLVTSATYRQSSRVSAALIAKDPENRLLARGTRLRLSAETIRDQALAVSGLLKHRIGGPSVSPYQPPGLWEELMSREDGANWSAQTFTQSHGEDLYRRTMYTFWKRTCPPPTLATFDAPDRETCTVRRARTNTPLQALVLLNDPTYVEASRKLAERLMTEAAGVDDRITLAFRLATARKPTEAEMGVLREVYQSELEHFRKVPKAAETLLSVGESARRPELDAAEVAAWATVSSAILNLDETVTKG